MAFWWEPRPSAAARRWATLATGADMAVGSAGDTGDAGQSRTGLSDTCRWEARRSSPFMQGPAPKGSESQCEQMCTHVLMNLTHLPLQQTIRSLGASKSPSLRNLLGWQPSLPQARPASLPLAPVAEMGRPVQQLRRVSTPAGAVALSRTRVRGWDSASLPGKFDS